MSVARSLRHASRKELRRRLAEGHPVDPAALEGWAYRGTSLGLPGVVEKLTWKTFQKTFWRDPQTGRLLGWNVRLEQDGIDAPSRARRRGEAPFTQWNYEVLPPDPRFGRGLVIDYGRAPNPALDTIRLVKDPLVALTEGDPTELLGVSWVVLGGLIVETPTYFTLVRDHPVDHVPDVFRR